jgi:hypothetical protein
MIGHALQPCGRASACAHGRQCGIRPAGLNKQWERVPPNPFFLRIVDFPSKQKLAERLMAFMDAWNETAHPFHWTAKSVAKIMAKCRSEDSKPLGTPA